MIDPDALRQLASDLDAKVDVCYLDAHRLADQGDAVVAAQCTGEGDAYFNVAARIREILADSEANEREDNG